MPNYKAGHTFHSPTGSRHVQNRIQEIGSDLLEDARLSPRNRFMLKNVLSFDLATLFLVAGLDDDAPVHDIISYLVKEYCSEITGLTVIFHDATNEITMTYKNEEAEPTAADPETEDESPAPAVSAALELQTSTSERIMDKAVDETLKSPVKPFTVHPDIPSDDTEPVLPTIAHNNQLSDINLDSETGPNVTDNDVSDVDSTAPFRTATNTVKGGNVLTIAEENVSTSNAYAAFSNDDDEDSAFEHNNMAQSVSSTPSSVPDHKRIKQPTRYREAKGGFEILDEIFTSQRTTDEVSIDDVNWWYSQVRKDIINKRSNVVTSIRDSSRDLKANHIKDFKRESATVTLSALDRLESHATAQCNKLIGKDADLQKTVRSAESVRLTLNQSHSLANDMMSSLDSHTTRIVQSDCNVNDVKEQIIALKADIASSDFVSLTALSDCVRAEATQYVSKDDAAIEYVSKADALNFVSHGEFFAMQRRITLLESAAQDQERSCNVYASQPQQSIMQDQIDRLEETLRDLQDIKPDYPPSPKPELPPSPKRKLFGHIDDSTFALRPPPTPEQTDSDNAQGRHEGDSIRDSIIPYFSTVTCKKANTANHYRGQVLACIIHDQRVTYKILNNVGSHNIVPYHCIVDVDTSTSIPNHPNYIEDNFSAVSKPPRHDFSPAGRGRDRHRRPSPVSRDHGYRSESYHDFDDDDQSDGGHRRFSNKPRPFSRNEYEYPIGTRNTIREDKVSAILTDTFVPLTPDGNPRDFYNKIRLSIAKYGMQLCMYQDASPDSSLLAFNPSNSLNYDAAATTTARVLYDLFEQGIEDLFTADNNYHRAIIGNYRESQDGFKLMKIFISHHHVNFRSTQKHANISTQYQLPQLRGQTLISYVAALSIWVTDNNPTMTQLTIFQLVVDQLKQDPIYTIARTDLQLHASRYASSPSTTVESAHTLAFLTDTILGYYDTTQKNSLLKPVPSHINSSSLDIPKIQLDIHSMIRDKKPFDKKPFPPKFQKATSAIDKDLFCFGCRSYGHEVTQCNKVGAAILIAEFLSKLDSAKKVVIRKEYLQNRKDAHAKYLLAHKDRGTMKKQIKALEYQIFPTDESRTSINETAWNAYTTGRDEIISTARIHNVNLDFGSLDEVYNDLEEPRFDFDPETDEFDM